MDFWREVWTDLKPSTIELAKWAGAGIALNLLGLMIWFALGKGPVAEALSFPLILEGFCCMWFIALKQAWQIAARSWKNPSK
jgi:hypothetical protein